MKRYFTFLIILFFSTYRIAAQPPGTLDSSFNSVGYVVTPFPLPTLDSHATSGAFQEDGKLVVAGFTNNGHGNIAVVRYFPDGIVDSAFGNNGIAIMPSFSWEDAASHVTIQSDNGIIIIGSTYDTNDNKIDGIVIRLLSNGTVDSSFGTDGHIIIDLSNDDDFLYSAEGIDGDKILIAGNSGNGLTGFLLRITQDGRIDSTFGINGFSKDFGFRIFTLKTLSDGKILLGGDDGEYCSILRFENSGSIDSSFGVDGISQHLFFIQSNACKSIDVQTDGKIVAAGYYNYGAGIFIARFSEDGFLDDDFDNDGAKIILGYVAYPNLKVLALPGGKIIIACGTYTNNSKDQSVIALNSNGTFDSFFGEDGITTTDFNLGYNEAVDAYLQFNNRIIVIGTAPDSSYICDQYFCISRYVAPELATSSPSLPNMIRYEVKPNPVMNSFSVSFEVTEKTQISFDLYDEMMNKIVQLSSSVYSAGTHIQELYLPSSVVSAMYFLVVRSPNSKIAAPIFVVNQ